MNESDSQTGCTVSVVLPCYNEQRTLRRCLDRLLAAFESRPELGLEVIVIDDGSVDRSLAIAREYARNHPQVSVHSHDRNQGKGAALRTGFKLATGDWVAIQDADLEYDPHDLVRLLEPLESGDADVVYGSRFLNAGAHRVLYFWHSLGNKFLTTLSNMFTDMNLTDMETCYKVFRREVLEEMEIEEDRFGFEPEITAKVAGQRLRVCEVGISYFGRTYAEGKKIGFRDGMRALYCVVKYNANRGPLVMQLLIYLMIGAVAALFNLVAFGSLLALTGGLVFSAAAAFILAAVLNYSLCIWLLFRHGARWSTGTELFVYFGVVLLVGSVDVLTTVLLVNLGLAPMLAKTVASVVGFLLNFIGRRSFVFPEPQRGPWQPQVDTESDRT
ncbi:MAG: bifunctional glycosyltransferase family 2/GtrA family protein [Mariniblastus sp.]|nr:bifunctional glycosyltransferase family 2/GtrA family protein [Mariniblastus sp.]